MQIITEIQTRRDPVTRDNDRSWISYLILFSVGYVYVGRCPVPCWLLYDLCMRLDVQTLYLLSVMQLYNPGLLGYIILSIFLICLYPSWVASKRWYDSLL